MLFSGSVIPAASVQLVALRLALRDELVEARFIDTLFCFEAAADIGVFPTIDRDAFANFGLETGVAGPL